ncbi:hypothetical protein A9Q90_02605 [Gammaproteobacteria bacterium 54_18_T64]|nr:hypothetical protein A9Q90_02605 [Gammaproteobacteria bacterium 54_18_T64]
MLEISSMGQSNLPVPPWYRQFWPWFLIALPAAVVVAGFFTLYLAIKYSDDLVSDNYYRDGLAINRRLSQDVRATELALSATFNFAAHGDGPEGVLALELSSGRENFVKPAALILSLLHPTDAAADRAVKLIGAGNGRYRGRLPRLAKLRFYLRLVPALGTELETVARAGPASLTTAPWRLAGAIDLASTRLVKLQAEPGVNQGDSPDSNPEPNAINNTLAGQKNSALADDGL